MDTKQGNFWEQLSALYEEALELPEQEQHRFVKNCCANADLQQELSSLLQVNENSLQYFDSLSENIITPAYEELSDLPPDTGRVKNYRLLDKLGRGGMGTVYLAERNDNTYESRVAVKILRRGMSSGDARKRFLAERQILARLNHPNITQLFDGGVTCDDRPYFVMEYVCGKPVTTWCDDHKLTIRERVRYFLQICQAIQYAHQNLVVHRDLKPGNILVTEGGQIKLLDFGIARLIDDENADCNGLAENKERVMTPEFASPEQVSCEPVNASSDIYQLGIVLYKLLTGVLPFSFKERTLEETEEIILGVDPDLPGRKVRDLQPDQLREICENRSVKPFRLADLLSGDLDAIVSKALRKDPSKRFSSVSELQEDLERYLENLPVKSREENIHYKITKFVRRNRTGTGIAVGLAALLILLGGLHSVRITQERNQARQEAQKAEQVTSFLMGLFEANDPGNTNGETLTARHLLEEGEQKIENLAGQPVVQAQMFDVTGQIYRRLGNFEKSRNFLEKSFEIRTELNGLNHPETASSLNQLAMLFSDQGAFSEADSLLRIALNIREKFLSPNDLNLASTVSNLAYVVRRKGHYDEAESLYRKSLRIRKNQLGSDHPLTLESLSSLGATLHNKGFYEETEEIYRTVLKSRLKVFDRFHPDVAMSMNSLGALLLNIGKFREAEQLFGESFEIYSKLYSEDHPKKAIVLNNLGITLSELGMTPEAGRYFREALDMRMRLFGNNNISTAISKFGLARHVLQSGRPDSALSLNQEALLVFEETLSPGHSFIARTRLAIGNSWLALGEMDRAKNYMEEAYQKILTIHSGSSLERALGEWEYSQLPAANGNYDEAGRLLRSAYNTLQDIEGESSLRQDKILSRLDSYNFNQFTQADNNSRPD